MRIRTVRHRGLKYLPLKSITTKSIILTWRTITDERGNNKGGHEAITSGRVYPRGDPCRARLVCHPRRRHFRRAASHSVRPCKLPCRRVAGDGFADRKGLWGQHGHAASHAGL